MPEIKEVDTLVLTHEQKIAELNTAVGVLEHANKQAHDEIEKLRADLKKAKAGRAAPEGNYAVFKGQTYPIIGDFRADQNFTEVKKGHCEEGITLLAIQRPH